MIRYLYLVSDCCSKVFIAFEYRLQSEKLQEHHYRLLVKDGGVYRDDV